MKIKGVIVLDGIFEVKHYRGGELIDSNVIHNTTTTVGFKKVAQLFNGIDGSAFKWIALDESSTSATAADTSLASEITSNGLDRASATCSNVTTTNTSDTAQLVHTWTATGTQVVYGAGIFDTSTASGGNMSARTTFPAKNLENGDVLTVTYKVKVY